MGVLDTLTGATAKREQVTMCVDGALQAEWDALNDSLDEAARKDSAADTGTLAIPNVTRIVNEMDAIRDQVKASEVTFIFEKMDWTERLELQAEHPPRTGQTFDRIRGFNVATFYPALIAGSCISVTGAGDDTVTDIPDEVWHSLLGVPATDDQPARVGSLNLAQVDKLIQAAEQVNDRGSAVPPSARFLLGSRDSGASLAQPSPGTSLRAGSADGSPRTSPKSSDTPPDTSTPAESPAT